MKVLSRSFVLLYCAAAAAAALTPASPALAGDDGWSLRLDGVLTDAYGHDQHVLTMHEIDDAAGTGLRSIGSLDTDESIGYLVASQYRRGDWGLGLDFVWYKTNQSGPDRRASADGAGGAVPVLVFETADRSYTSTGPGEELYYERLEDTALAMWTVDLYGMKTLLDGDKVSLDLRFGLRNADFDNDYRVIVGLENVAGTRYDASSNYDRMIGPYLGLSAAVDHGRNHIEVHLGQALQLGTVELTGRTRDYTGSSAPYALPLEEITGSFDSMEEIHTSKDVAIPATDLRLAWAYRLNDMLSAGLGVHVSTWWDVPVPPGVIPGEGGNQVLHENTIVFFGLGLGLEMRF
jgi:hypothetical protein